MYENVQSLLKGWVILLFGSLLLGLTLYGFPWVAEQPSLTPWFYTIRLASHYTLIASAIVFVIYGTYLCLLHRRMLRDTANPKWTLIISGIMILVGLLWTQFFVVFIYNLAAYITGYPLSTQTIWYLDFVEMRFVEILIGSFVISGILQVLIGAYLIALGLFIMISRKNNDV